VILAVAGTDRRARQVEEVDDLVVANLPDWVISPVLDAVGDQVHGSLVDLVPDDLALPLSARVFDVLKPSGCGRFLPSKTRTTARSFWPFGKSARRAIPDVA
jgi:hypothetical protein